MNEKSERGELIYSSGRLLPRQWDHQYEMARTICWSAVAHHKKSQSTFYLLTGSMLLNLSLGIRPKPDSAGLLDAFKIKGFTQNVKHFSLTSNDRSLWKSFGRQGLPFSQEKMTS